MTFFTPTGPVLLWFIPEVSAFVCWIWPCVVILSSVSFHVYVLRVWSCAGWCLVVPYRVACLPEALPLLHPCDRVVWSCVVTVWSGHGLVVCPWSYAGCTVWS